MFGSDNFKGYSADYNAINNSRILHQSPTSLDNFYRPPFYCPPFVHWLPEQYAIEDFRGGIAGTSIGKHRRNRTAFSQQQLSVLESSFSDTQYPDLETRDRLSRATGLPETKIQVWFKNRRAKCRKLQKANDKTTPHTTSSSSGREREKEDTPSTSPSLHSPSKKRGRFSCPMPKMSDCTNTDTKDNDSDVSVGGDEKANDNTDFATVDKPQVSFSLADKQVTKNKESLMVDKKPSYSMRSSDVCYDGVITQPLNLTIPTSQPAICHRQSSAIPFLNNLDSASRYIPWMYPSLTNPWPLVYYGTPSSFYPPSSAPRHHPLMAAPSAVYSDRIAAEETHPIDFVSSFDNKRL